MGAQILPIYKQFSVDFKKSTKKMLKNICAKCFALGSRRGQETQKMKVACIESVTASVGDLLPKSVAP